MTKEETTQLRKLFEERCLTVDDLIDCMDQRNIAEALEHFSTHCNCGNALKEHEQEGGFCGECL